MRWGESKGERVPEGSSRSGFVLSMFGSTNLKGYSCATKNYELLRI